MRQPAVTSKESAMPPDLAKYKFVHPQMTNWPVIDVARKI